MIPLDLDDIRSAVVVAPHPDDEIIGAFGLMRALVRRGARVRVVVVTDGSASHPNSPSHPRERLIAARRAECRRGLSRAGVRARSIRYLAHRDATLARYDPRRRRRLARDIAHGPAPDLLVVPTHADDHPDHRAVARACRGIWPECRRRLAYPVWPRPGHRPPRLSLFLTLGPQLRRMKQSALHCHATQTGAIDDDPNGFTMSPEQRARFCRAVERFERV
ncbi:PIG-L family deacetylase [Salinisphaera sp.]|uniref:PIG-L deacetylase family protein n=1 Tax=Salinisphaera sp. TaxID=1914330 RepID=UPI002D79EB53|nr:PIG-L family deacetylase [Salinisphaera sp.]HET7312783.1 PIG-L family deacetylase [Salinisphaera sp.]